MIINEHKNGRGQEPRYKATCSNCKRKSYVYKSDYITEKNIQDLIKKESEAKNETSTDS